MDEDRSFACQLVGATVGCIFGSAANTAMSILLKAYMPSVVGNAAMNLTMKIGCYGIASTIGVAVNRSINKTVQDGYSLIEYGVKTLKAMKEEKDGGNGDA